MSNEEEKEENPWMNVLIGLAILVFTYYCFSNFTKYEAGEEVSMNRILFLIYKLGGKYVACGILGVIGVAVAGLGLKGLLSKKA